MNAESKIKDTTLPPGVATSSIRILIDDKHLPLKATSCLSSVLGHITEPRQLDGSNAGAFPGSKVSRIRLDRITVPPNLSVITNVQSSLECTWYWTTNGVE